MSKPATPRSSTHFLGQHFNYLPVEIWIPPFGVVRYFWGGSLAAQESSTPSSGPASLDRLGCFAPVPLDVHVPRQRRSQLLHVTQVFRLPASRRDNPGPRLRRNLCRAPRPKRILQRRQNAKPKRVVNTASNPIGAGAAGRDRCAGDVGKQQTEPAQLDMTIYQILEEIYAATHDHGFTKFGLKTLTTRRCQISA